MVFFYGQQPLHYSCHILRKRVANDNEQGALLLDQLSNSRDHRCDKCGWFDVAELKLGEWRGPGQREEGSMAAASAGSAFD
jgi:hypothetical protein